MVQEKGHTSFRKVLEVHGKIICSPVTGSMRPLIRPKTDCAVLEKVDRPLRKYDVVIYTSGDKTVLHRVIDVPKEDGNGKVACGTDTLGGDADKKASGIYLIRGDANTVCEQVPADQIYGVMVGLYRGEHYLSCDSFPYRILSRLIVAVNPLIAARRKIRHRLSKIRCLKEKLRQWL